MVVISCLYYVTSVTYRQFRKLNTVWKMVDNKIDGIWDLGYLYGEETATCYGQPTFMKKFM